MKRILSIWLPRLAVERWARSSDLPPDAPVVLTVEGTHGPIIHAVTQAAAERGARAGARLTDARALDPALVAVPADPAGDAALVERLARWAGRWSPLVEVDGADGLRLDVTGVAHLFGGERGLVADVQARFARRRALDPYCASRRRPRRPGRLAHYGNAPAIICGTNTGAKLADLPVAALRLPPEATRTLERLGLKTIGTLAGIERRCARPALPRGRQSGRCARPRARAQARAADRRSAERPPRALLKLEEPATHPEAAAQALERLIPDSSSSLQRRHLGARRLSLIGFRVDGSIGRRLGRDVDPEPRAEASPAPARRQGGDARSRASASMPSRWNAELEPKPLGAAQDSLVEEPSGEREVARLVDRLSVKLGPDKVRRPQRA